MILAGPCVNLQHPYYQGKRRLNEMLGTLNVQAHRERPKLLFSWASSCGLMFESRLELECKDGFIPIFPIEQFKLSVSYLFPEVIKTTYVDAVHIGCSTRIAEWMDAAKFAEPV